MNSLFRWVLGVCVLGSCSPLDESPATTGQTTQQLLFQEFPLSTPRWWHTATSLTSGKYKNQILIVGGANASYAPVEDPIVIFNPLSGESTSLAASDGDVTFQPRYWHTAVTVGAADERDSFVLIMGGCDSTAKCTCLPEDCAGPLKDVWRFSMLDGSLSKTDDLLEGRAEHTATSIGTLEKPLVFVVGGNRIDEGELGSEGTMTEATTEVYAPMLPSGAQRRSGPNLASPRFGHTTAVTGDNVVVIGGSNKRADEYSDKDHELDTSVVMSKGALRKADASAARAEVVQMAFAQGPRQHTSTYLPKSEKILSAGSAATRASIQLFDPSDGVWTEIQGAQKFRLQAAVGLKSQAGSDLVMFLGGMRGSSVAAGANANLFNADSETWEEVDGVMRISPMGHTATVTADGNRAVVFGGISGTLVPSIFVIGALPKGSSCTANTECLSNFCVSNPHTSEKRCCDRACTGDCETCDKDDGASSNGVCTARGRDYECRAAKAESCDIAEYCTGGPACPEDRHSESDICSDPENAVGDDTSEPMPDAAVTMTVNPPPPPNDAGDDNPSGDKGPQLKSATPLSCSLDVVGRPGTVHLLGWTLALAMARRRRRV